MSGGEERKLDSSLNGTGTKVDTWSIPAAVETEYSAKPIIPSEIASAVNLALLQAHETFRAGMATDLEIFKARIRQDMLEFMQEVAATIKQAKAERISEGQIDSKQKDYLLDVSDCHKGASLKMTQVESRVDSQKEKLTSGNRTESTDIIVSKHMRSNVRNPVGVEESDEHSVQGDEQDYLATASTVSKSGRMQREPQHLWIYGNAEKANRSRSNRNTMEDHRSSGEATYNNLEDHQIGKFEITLREKAEMTTNSEQNEATSLVRPQSIKAQTQQHVGNQWQIMHNPLHKHQHGSSESHQLHHRQQQQSAGKPIRRLPLGCHQSGVGVSSYVPPRGRPPEDFMVFQHHLINSNIVRSVIW